MNDLPDEIISEILLYLKSKAIIRISAINHRLNNICNNTFLLNKKITYHKQYTNIFCVKKLFIAEATNRKLVEVAWCQYKGNIKLSSLKVDWIWISGNDYYRDIIVRVSRLLQLKQQVIHMHPENYIIIHLLDSGDYSVYYSPIVSIDSLNMERHNLDTRISSIDEICQIECIDLNLCY